jgi:SRSO17 transposase
MKPKELRALDRELTEFVDPLWDGLGRSERRRALSWYVTGLLLDGGRKSIEPIASRLVESASEVEAMRQRLQQTVAFGTWSDDEVRRRLARKVEERLPQLEAFVIDDTGFPKKGRHSVGVARQYSGTLGRVDNCQVAVSLHLAGEATSVCIGMRLYLPEEWASDRARRQRAGVPDEIEFHQKWRLALRQLDEALGWGVRKRVVLADPGYGDNGEFRTSLRNRELPYLVGVSGAHVVWPPEAHPQVPESPERGRPRTRFVDEVHPPESLATLAKRRGRRACRVVHWRNGSVGQQRSRFGAMRVRSAHDHLRSAAPGPEEWLLYEWPADEDAPTKFWLSSLPPDTPITWLVRLAKLRWRVERDYQEMKEEVGLDHYEGRTWVGFHHHATLCAVAHAFLALRRALFPPANTSMDSPRRPPRASGDPPSSNRPLSPLQTRRPRSRPTTPATHLIK